MPKRSKRRDAGSGLQPWRVLASEHVLNDQWIRVRSDDCLTHEGVAVAPYYVLEYSDWVHVVPIDRDGRLVLIRQYRHGAGAVSLELPAGHMDECDADPLATARRELLEETGCRCDRVEQIACWSPNPASHANRVHTVVAYGVQAVQEPDGEGAERTVVTKATTAELLEMISNGEVIASIQIASIFAGLMHLGRLRHL